MVEEREFNLVRPLVLSYLDDSTLTFFLFFSFFSVFFLPLFVVVSETGITGEVFLKIKLLAMSPC